MKVALDPARDPAPDARQTVPGGLLPDRRAALLAIVPALLAIAIIAHHPVVRVAHPGAIDEIVHGVGELAGRNAAFHALVLVLWAVQALGLFAFAERLGADRAIVRAGILFEALSLALVFVAGTVDGFVTPLIAAHCAARPETCLAQLGFGFATIQGATRVGLGAQAIALACWSIALATRARLRGVAFAGLLLSIGALVELAPTITIDPSRLRTIAAFEVAWTVGAAVLLWTGRMARFRVSHDDAATRT